MVLDKKTSEELWGEEGPYSQVQITKEIRILDEKISREFYYVYANINPATYKILKKNKKKIKEDFIHEFLRDAEFKSEKEGYIWYLYTQQTNNPKEANIIAKKLTGMVIRMHRMVMKYLRIGVDRET
jgi:sulfur relay (sulfurtransferase) DsrC/TusE family protein